MTLFLFVNQPRFRPRSGHPQHWGGNDFFLKITSAATSFDANPSNFVLITSQTKSKWATAQEQVGQGKKTGHKDLWLIEIGHGTKKVKNH